MGTRGGSSRGYHFISEYRSCPRKWFLRHIVGLESPDMNAGASMGSIIHAAQEKFFCGSFEDYNANYLEEIQALAEPYRSAWFEDEEYEEAVVKMAAGFQRWRNEFGKGDLLVYDTVGVELELRATLPIGVEVTGRIDRLFREKGSGALVIHDTKTTSWGAEAAHKKVELDDQVTMYTWLIHQHYGDQPVEMIPDIMYMRPKVPTCHRFGAVRRNHNDVEALIWGLCHDYEALRKDMECYENNCAPPEFLFPRHATVCSEFGCEFEAICRSRLDETTPPPVGYTRYPPLTSSSLFPKNGLDNTPDRA